MNIPPVEYISSYNSRQVPHFSSVPNDTTTATCTTRPSPSNDDTNSHRREGGPSYKDQCRSINPDVNLLAANRNVMTSSEIPARCSDTQSSSSTTAVQRSCIPLVFGILIIEHQTNSEMHVSHNRHDPQTHEEPEEIIETNCDTEQAPVPNEIFVHQKTVPTRHSTLTDAEKRYWIKVVMITIIVNTLIVLVGVIGGVCGMSGCHLTNRTVPFGNENNTSANHSVGPTSSPSRYLATTDAPAVAIAVDAPTNTSDTAEILTPTGTGFESLSYPSSSPHYRDTIHPTTSPTKAGTVSKEAIGVRLRIIVPTAIAVDLVLTITFLFCHYTKWIKTKNKL
jgi:hypothetical protein